MEQIEDDLYRIEVPLTDNPLGSVNSYLIKGTDRNLMIDTAFNSDDCRAVLEEALNTLDVNRDKLDIFATHLHSDHTGLAPHLSGKDSNFYLNEFGIEVLSTDKTEMASDFEKQNGFPEDQLDDLFEGHPGNTFSGDDFSQTTSLTDGQVLEVGSYRLRVVDTPGHTLGHQCLYEPDREILFSGDHVLGDITPNISVHSYDTRYTLVYYLESLDEIANLTVRYALPGHRTPLENFQARVEELKRHHALRAEEVLEILETEPKNSYQVAEAMSWDVPLDDWADFPVVQRWFATGEALAHLWLLEDENELEVLEEGGETVFRVT